MPVAIDLLLSALHAIPNVPQLLSVTESATGKCDAQQWDQML
jgi:hypothetical protein